MEKRGKRAQITILIIIALFIICAMVFFVVVKAKGQESDVFKNNNILKKMGFKSELDAVKSSISECIEQRTRSSLRTIGIQGGLYNKPAKYSDLGWAFIPYYYNQGEILIPTKNKIQEELALYVDDRLTGCFDSLKFKNYQLSYNKPRTQTWIAPGRVKFMIDLPITLSKGTESSVLQLKDFPVEYNSTLNEIYEISEYITNSHKDENSTMMCINCITEMAKQRNVYVDFIDYEDSSTLVMISENWTYKEPYLFEFLNKY